MLSHEREDQQVNLLFEIPEYLFDFLLKDKIVRIGLKDIVFPY